MDQSACERELAARHEAYGKCLMLVADDAKYERCLAKLEKRKTRDEESRRCYRYFDQVCLRLAHRVHDQAIDCYGRVDPEQSTAQDISVGGKRWAEIEPVVRSCQQLLKDAAPDRGKRACEAFDKLLRALSVRKALHQAVIRRAGGMDATRRHMSEVRDLCEDPGRRWDKIQEAWRSPCRLIEAKTENPGAVGLGRGSDAGGPGSGSSSSSSSNILMYVLMFGVMAVGGGFLLMRRFRMKQTVAAPLTEQEREERARIPAHFAALSVEELQAGLVASAKLADVYLESAQKAIGSARGLGLLDMVGVEINAGAGGVKQDAIKAILDDVMQADRFLLEVHHQQVLLRQKETGEEASSISPGDPDFATFDWVLDNALSDILTMYGLSQLRQRIAATRESLARIIGPPDEDADGQEGGSG